MFISPPSLAEMQYYIPQVNGRWTSALNFASKMATLHIQHHFDMLRRDHMFMRSDISATDSNAIFGQDLVVPMVL